MDNMICNINLILPHKVQYIALLTIVWQWQMLFDQMSTRYATSMKTISVLTN